jgi:hypothetical protein
VQGDRTLDDLPLGPMELARLVDLAQVSDPDALRPIVLDVVEAHPHKAKAYVSGKTGLLGVFMGQIMHETRGEADPELAKRLLVEVLGGVTVEAWTGSRTWPSSDWTTCAASCPLGAQRLHGSI